MATRWVVSMSVKGVGCMQVTIRNRYQSREEAGREARARVERQFCGLEGLVCVNYVRLVSRQGGVVHVR